MRTIWLTMLLVAGWASAARGQATAPAKVATPLMQVLSHVPGGNTVGGEVREKTPRADGYFHIDTPRMIARLRELHVNNVNYLLWNSPSDWDDLRNEFLPAAQAAGLKVWTYLVPPNETFAKGKGSDPYRTDYEKWAAELAELSNRFPALEAWVMDDFTWNLKTFTPDYVRKLHEVARGINPSFRFIPVIHFTAISDKWAADYGPSIDGVMCPYLDLPYNNTQRVSSLNQQIDGARAKLKVPVYVLLYAGRHLTSPIEPTPQYVGDALDILLPATRGQRIGGVISYATAIDPQTPATSSNAALDGTGRLSLSAAGTKSDEKDFAEASQTLTVDPNAARYWLSFWHHDQWGPPQYEKGHFMKQVLIDGNVVWECDAAADVRLTWLEGSILQGPVELTPLLKGKTSALLTMRLQSIKPGGKQPIDVSFDRVVGTGFTVKNGGFESDDAWELHDAGRGLLAAIDHRDADQPRRVFEAVARKYAHLNAKQADSEKTR